jgi:hypothetical protein
MFTGKFSFGVSGTLPPLDGVSPPPPPPPPQATSAQAIATIERVLEIFIWNLYFKYESCARSTEKSSAKN